MLTMVANDGAWAMILPSVPSPLCAGNIIASTAYRIMYRIARCTVTEDQKYEENTRSKFTENVNWCSHACTQECFIFPSYSFFFSFSLSFLLCLVFFLSCYSTAGRDNRLRQCTASCAATPPPRTTWHACHMTRSCISRSRWPAASARRTSDAKTDYGAKLRLRLYRSGFSSWRAPVWANRQRRRLPSQLAPTQTLPVCFCEQDLSEREREREYERVWEKKRENCCERVAQRKV